MNSIKNNLLSVKVATATFTLFLFCLFSCKIEKDTNKINKINYLFNLPIVETNSNLFNRTDSLSIYYKKNMILYELPYIQLIDNGLNKDGEQRRYSYFALKKGNKYGYFYRYLEDIEFRKLKVDSLLKLKVFYGSDFYDPKKFAIDKTIKTDKNYILIEKYLSKKTSFDYPDTAVYFYSKTFKNIDHSLSRYLDSTKKFKVAKVRFLHNEKYSDEYKIILPKREWRFEMREDTIGNIDKYLQLFEKFNKQSKE